MGYANLAAWMTSELFQAAGTAIAISLKPGTAGAFKVTVDKKYFGIKKLKVSHRILWKLKN
ncbi:MAG: hypothetical protein Ct9H90mP2_03050 [Dehalococcoidia bacterium]|nr:MAG: hypothetical protein Ct9H90mP2_03050 [Dehalococcoidia bacterium]